MRFINARVALAGVILSIGFPGAAVLAQTAKSHLPKNDTTMRQNPTVKTFGSDACAPGGDGGDPELNRLKNRIDWPKNNEFLWVVPSAITQHQSPNTGKKLRVDWKKQWTDTVSAYEGLPVMINGYLVNDDRYGQATAYGAEEQGPETTNCHALKGDGDIHVWIAAQPHQHYGKAIVAEFTPRVIANDDWGSEDELQTKLKAIAKADIEVQVSGWLLFDQEHHPQLSASKCGAQHCPRRATLWEIHPILDFEVVQGDSLVSLKNWKPE